MCYNFCMNVDLSRYSGKRICVACSGGRDSMALLSYLSARAEEFGIQLSALNCDHGMRGEESRRDSLFVRDYCLRSGIPLLFFEASQKFRGEVQARLWRISCYAVAAERSSDWDLPPADRPQVFSSDGEWRGCDAVACAHHMNDNAETVLFNLARGSALSGMCGIQDERYSDKLTVIHPFVAVTRGEIDSYVAEHNLPYVDDKTNFSDDYTRNYIRHNVLPELERAVPGAVRAIFRFSRLAAEDEEYFSRLSSALISDRHVYGKTILFCGERAVFKRAAIDVVEGFRVKDYTSVHAEALYNLQFAENGKKFCFLGLTAIKEEGGVTIFRDDAAANAGAPLAVPFFEAVKSGEYCGQLFKLSSEEIDLALYAVYAPVKVLKFDLSSLPRDAEVRTMRRGDKFTKYGGGTKSLGDFFTDRKIARPLRGQIPLVASGSRILIAGGVEISDEVKVSPSTERVAYLVAPDYSKM